MARRVETILICDLCKEVEGDKVSTHTVQVDRKAREVEACEKCWSKVEKATQPVIQKGRRTQKKPPTVRQGAS